ncbi:MAG: hypothetical protein CENE_03176 [Candidatus Celerinatantimonas neptuna]|nr:MAG: hypothetical protein CENE_03176 [Candidatus Celerinatantimonas neptuna]
MNNAFVQLMLTQFRQYIREPQILFWSFGFPMLLIWMLGAAFSSHDVPVHHIGVLLPHQASQQQQVKQWGKHLMASHHFIPSVLHREKVKEPDVIQTKYHVLYFKTYPQMLNSLKQGDIQVMITPVMRKGKLAWHYALDPENHEAMLTYYSLTDLEHSLNHKVQQNLKVLQTPGLRYIDFLIPGMVAMAVMETCLITVGWALLEKRMTRVARQMYITPMRKSTFLLAHLMSCFLINYGVILILYWFSKTFFGISIQGSFTAFLLLIFAGNICFSGIAVLLSSRAKKAQTANGMMEVAILVQLLISGIFFSYKHLPFSNIIGWMPLTFMAEMMRKVFIEGAGLMSIWPTFIGLSVIGIVTFIVGMRIFRWY